MNPFTEITQAIRELSLKQLNGELSPKETKDEVIRILQLLFESDIDIADRQQQIEQLFEHSDMGKRNFNRLVKMTERDARTKSIERYGLKVIEKSSTLPMRNYFEDIIEAVCASDCFIQNNAVVQITDNQDYSKVNILSKDDLVGLVASKATIQRERNNQIVHNNISHTDANTLLHAPDILAAKLRTIKSYTGIVGLNSDLQVYQPGYNPVTKHYYFGADIQAKQNQKALDTFLNFFRWQSDDDKRKFHAYCLVLLLRDQILSQYTALQLIGPTGVGKTTAAKSIDILFSNGNALWFQMLNPNETLNQIATAIKHGSQLIINDNFRGTSDSTIGLDFALTAPKLQIRLLHSNTLIEREFNDLIYIMTCNGGDISPDFERRCLFVGFDYNFDINTESLGSLNESIIEYVTKNRVDILGHFIWEIQSIASQHRAEFHENLRTNWKQMVSFLAEKVYNSPLNANIRIFQTYKLYPLLQLLTQNKMMSLGNICNLRLNERIKIEQRNKPFFNKPDTSRVLDNLLIKATDHIHIIESKQYRLQRCITYGVTVTWESGIGYSLITDEHIECSTLLKALCIDDLREHDKRQYDRASIQPFKVCTDEIVSIIYRNNTLKQIMMTMVFPNHLGTTDSRLTGSTLPYYIEQLFVTNVNNYIELDKNSRWTLHQNSPTHFTWIAEEIDLILQ